MNVGAVQDLRGIGDICAEARRRGCVGVQRGDVRGQDAGRVGENAKGSGGKMESEKRERFFQWAARLSPTMLAGGVVIYIAGLVALVEESDAVALMCFVVGAVAIAGSIVLIRRSGARW